MSNTIITTIQSFGIGDPIGYLTTGLLFGAVLTAGLSALFIAAGVPPLVAAGAPVVVIGAGVAAMQPDEPATNDR